jgi:hypothetical protein
VATNYNEQFHKKWTARLSSAAAKGVDVKKLMPVIHQDWQRVKTGSQPWSDVQAALVSRSVLSGKPIITHHDTGGGGILGAITAPLKGAIHDVQSVAEGLLPWNLADTVIKQGEAIGHDPGVLLKPLETLGKGDIGGALEQASKTPGLQLIPGVYTAASLAKGDFQDILNHPILHTLDVLPYASEAGKLATAGRVVEGTAEAAKVADEAQLIEKGSPAEALKEGKPLKAAFRKALGETTAPKSEAGIKALEAGKSVWRTSDAAKALAEKVGINKEIQDLAAFRRVLGRKIGIHGRTAWDEVNGLFGKMSEKERVQVYEEAVRWKPDDHGNIPPTHERIILNLKKISEGLGRRGVVEGGLVEIPTADGKMEIYSIESPVAKRFTAYQKKLNKQGATEQKLVEATDETRPALEKKLAEQKIATDKANAQFRKAVKERPSARYDTLLQDMLKQRLGEKVHEVAGADSHLTPTQVQSALDSIMAHDFHKLINDGVMTEKDVQAIVRDVTANWQELAKAGYDPVFIPHTPSSKLDYLLDQKPGSSGVYTPTPWLDKNTLSFAPGVKDSAIGLTNYAVELMKAEATKQYLEHVKAYTVSEADIVNRYGATEAATRLREDYVPVSEMGAKYLGRRTMDVLPNAEHLFLPKTMSKNVERVMGQMDRMTGVVDKATGVYKFAVLTGPRHIAHVEFSNLMYMMLEEGPFPLLKMREAHKMIKDGLPATFQRGLDYFTPDAIASYATGKSLGRVLRESLGKPFEAIKHFEETSQDMFRAMSYLHEFEKMKGKGVETEAAAEAAMHVVNKVYMNVDSMTPIERTVLKTIFPFYAFTKQTLRYVLRYPADHPLRASILARITQIEQKDQQSGLPGIFRNLIFLGGPDKNGYQQAIDMKPTNPFRMLDGQNPFTLAGVISALNPAITAPFSMAGFNSLTATGELYPQLAYDPRTGGIVASHPNAASDLIAHFLPPAQALQAVFQMTDKWRTLKQSNPEAFKTALGSALNLPFGVGPGGFEKVSMSRARSTAELNRYKVAQQAEQRAMKSGDSTALVGYNLVPFEGQLISGKKIAQLIEELKKYTKKGQSPGSILPRSKKAALALVNALPSQ